MTVEEARRWWSFQPLPAGPAVESHDIDALLEREWASRRLVPAPPADRRTLIRRATYDLTGLPPTPAETAEFLADESPDAFAKLVDRLLDSPQYGVRWGRHWLDVVRYADTAGETTDRPLPHAWRYRNWVFAAMQRDMPFDRFVKMQIAGDLLTHGRHPRQRAEGIVATGYLAIDRRFGHDIDADIHLTHEDAIDNLGKNFLGLSVACARCHDHKYDPINADDYYAIYGILDSTRFAFPGCESKGKPRDLVPLITQAEIDSLMQPWQRRQEHNKRLRDEQAEATRRVFAPEAGQATQVVQSGDVAEGAAVELAPARLSVRKGEVVLLAVEPRAGHGADTTLVELRIREPGGRQGTGAPQTWSTGDLIDTLTASNPQSVEGASWCFVELSKDGPAFLLERADSIAGNGALKKWSRGAEPAVLVNSADQQVMLWTTLAARSFFVHPGPNRPVAIAWVSPLEGEITIEGRVADVHPAALDGVAFRLEHVARPETGLALLEAGRLLATSVPAAEPPTHPELLDRLASEFVRGGFRFKAMHRRLMLTTAYQRAAATPVAEDPDNRWLAHFSRRRLDADEIRDSLLAASGRLDPSFGRAHPFPPEERWNFTQHNPFNAVYEMNRRSGFLMVQRQQRHPFLSLFDGADPNASTPMRPTTTRARKTSFRTCSRGTRRPPRKTGCVASLRPIRETPRTAGRRSVGCSWPSMSSSPWSDHMETIPGTRRAFLRSAAAGSMLYSGIVENLLADSGDPLAMRTPHFPARAKNVIFLFMTGGVSHVDSFDPKPELARRHGQEIEADHPEIKNRPGYERIYLKRPQWEFKPHGRCGTEVSSLFPHVADCVDDIAVIRSMHTSHSNHYNATLGMHTGSFTFARPSIGSWVTYGPGTLNRNLPGFVVIAPRQTYAGTQVYASDFLPGAHQGTLVVPGARPVDKPVHVRDFHSTILHLMGFDHERLTCRHAGLDHRLTGVEHAHVVDEILA